MAFPRSNCNSYFGSCDTRIKLLKNEVVPRSLVNVSELDVSEGVDNSYLFVDANGTDKKVALEKLLADGPDRYLKKADVYENTLTLFNKDDTTVAFTPKDTTYSAGENIYIDEDNKIHATIGRANNLLITMTKDENNQYVCDKTPEEVVAAYNEGKVLMLKDTTGPATPLDTVHCNLCCYNYTGQLLWSEFSAIVYIDEYEAVLISWKLQANTQYETEWGIIKNVFKIPVQDPSMLLEKLQQKNNTLGD